jgi:hypothetical protein
MSKTFIKFFITIWLSILLINSNSIAFHKAGNSEKDIQKIEGIKKKDIQSEYCTIQVEPYSKAPKTKKKEDEKIKEKSEEKESITTDAKESEIADEQFYKIISYHSKETKKAPKELDFSILKNKINKNRYIGPISTIEDLLAYYCVQEIPLDGKTKIFKKGNSKLYDEIAIINGYSGRKSSIEGPIYDKGKISLAIEGKSLIYAEAQFIFNEKKRLEEKEKKDEEARKAKEEADRLAKEKIEEEKKRERDWIDENRPPLIKKIKLKIKEFDDKIAKYNNTVNDLIISHENFSKYFNEKRNEIEDLLDLVDVGQKEIKDKAIELKKAKRKYLNDNILNNINTKFKKIKKKKAKEFKIYKEIIVLLNEVGSSKKQNDFEKGYKSKHWKKKMEGFFVQWDQLSNKDLDINKFFDEIDNIYVDLISAESNINENIDTLQTEIQKLEEELANKWPIKEIAISVIIFFVICVGGYFIYDSGQKRKREREEAESKIASLKNDLEGKFKSTSEQIKSVSRTAARSQETFLENEAPESIHEQPKTPEEIITEKYDQLVSDYKDALDDFSKVAGFKEKWQGLALSRKERQDGTKTILTNSTRAFEKAEIWCVTFSDKYFAFPGSSVKFNMATYMNLDFEKAGRDFKGVFSVSTGSNYSAEPSVLRRGGAGFVVERTGKIIFPN